MRASDIVNQLAVRLPALVNDFTDQFSVTSLARVGTTVTATTSAAHGLVVNQQVNITGAQTPITISSLTRVGIVGTLVTAADHDITENAGFDVQISGATEAEFNGTFVLLSQPNRRTITFIMVDSGPTTATGSPLLLNGSSPLQQYNGLQKVTVVPTTTTFEYEVTDSTLFTPAAGTIVAKTNPRITSSVAFERIEQFYTKQAIDDAYLIVVLGDGIANKNRNIDTDATDNIQRGNYFNQKLIQGVSLFLLIPTSAQIAGRKARDRAEELLSPICQSILTAKFPSLVENDNNPLMLSSHGFQDYTGAVYVHQYAFEATLQLGPTDIFEPDDDVAFRDIDLTIGMDVGTETFNTLIDLDDEILP
jgi:hypothetical protein